MSFLDSVLGGAQNAIGQSGAVAMAGALIQRAGGVQGLVSMLQQHGLGDAVQSWVGSGSNQAISPGQLGQLLEKTGLGSVVQEAAGKLGMEPSAVLGQLAQVLPHAVDHLTPDGQVPATGGGFNLGMLEGLAGKLLGGA